MAKAREAFRTISEVADWLGVQTHVLRFWESKFSQVKPLKRAGGRRYYRPADMELLGGIKRLLHDDGMTIKGVQKILKEKGVKEVSAMCLLDTSSEAPAPAPAPEPVKAEPEAAQVQPEVAEAPVAAAEPEAEAPEAEQAVAEEVVAEEVVAEEAEVPAEAPAPIPEDAEPETIAGLPSFMKRPLGETTVPPPVSPPPLAEAPAKPAPVTITSAAVIRPEPVPAQNMDQPMFDLGTPEPAPAEPEAEPEPEVIVHRPWPDAGLPLDQALAKLEPGAIPADQLRPLLQRLTALRDAQDARAAAGE
ncbi:MerR family transcriptional regulator [Harenicola maris]|uniref:MerR family transcriptional regulator n=1 Tax=Harenicola maris TaxID=2841044 RepID=UPI002E18F188